MIKGFLNATEIGIVKQLRLGRLYQEIADENCTSINVVRNHCRNIFWKLQVHSRKDACEKFYRTIV